VYRSSVGELYSGVFRNGKLHGQGYWKSRNGDEYRGSFRKGKSHGKGKLQLTNGDVYIGEFKNGKFDGKGKYTHKSGNEYIGHWKCGKQEGDGVHHYTNGSSKRVVYSDGKIIDSDRGNIVDVNLHRPATNTKDESRVHRLEEVTRDCTNANCHDELGIFRYGDGTRYIGEFSNGFPEGIGRCEFANGDVYEGEWKMHAPNGEGLLTFASGRKHAAIWDNGIPKEQLLEDIDYTSKLKISEKTFDEDVDVYALVVGVANYQHMPSLKYTDDDAYQLYAFLRSPEGGAIPRQNVKVLIDDVATKNNIENAMVDLFSKADENDVIMLYMSGHGLKGSFIPSDFDGFKNQLSYNTINQILSESDAKHKVVIADACHSGSLMTSRGSDYAPAINSYYSILENLKNGGTAMLLSSSEKETSLEYAGLRQGVFTHFLMRGLGGEADVDHDKVVTITELYAFMHAGVQKYTQHAQTPILTGSYNRDMPLAVIR